MLSMTSRCGSSCLRRLEASLEINSYLPVGSNDNAESKYAEGSDPPGGYATEQMALISVAQEADGRPRHPLTGRKHC